MFGVLVGTLSLLGLLKVARHGRHWGRHGFHGRRRWLLRRLYQRLDTTPGQEKVIDASVEDVEKAARAMADEARRARTEYARAMREEAFDTQTVQASFERQKAALEEVQKAVLAGMQQLHEALDPEQRREVSELLEFGPRAMGGHCSHHRAHRHAAHAV